MAKPRVFVSSTFYDLRQVRSDLEIFIKELGFDPVLNERGNIPYGKEDRLEEYCYKEISTIDLFVSIIGGRLGCESQHESFSVSQMEFRTAFQLNKQVYIFIDKNVSAEYQTYLLNKQNKDIKYRFADSVRIYEFIESCEKLPANNTIHAFETSGDIIRYLKEQWAGLFQQFLKSQSGAPNDTAVKMTENEHKALSQYCNLVGKEPERAVPLIQHALWSDHPAVKTIRRLLNVPYRFYFISEDELDEFLASRKFRRTDFLNCDEEIVYCRIQRKQMKKQLLAVKRELFSAMGELKIFGPMEWKQDFIFFSEEPLLEAEPDDLPF